MVATPRLLLLETSGRTGRVGLAEGPALLRARRLDETRRHARDLAPALQELLAQQGWRPADLHGVLVSRGPGSYTGLRVGLMSAKTLAYATGCALVLVDTLAVVTRQAPAGAARLDAVADAQQGKIYVQGFMRSPGGDWEASTPLRIEKLEDWLAGHDPGAWVTGSGLHAYGDRVPQAIPRPDPETWDPQLEGLLALGLARYARGERDDFWAAEPLYLRGSSAEEKWQQRAVGGPSSRGP